MRESELLMRGESATVDGRDGAVNLWADSVGAAATQLGLIVTFAIVAQLAGKLLSGV